MLSIIILALCGLQSQIVHGSVSVSTPPFDLVNQTLQVAFNDTLINPPGLTIPLSVPLATPTIGLTSPPLKDTYLVILVDPNAGQPDVLHWFQTNLTLSASNVTVASLSFHPLLSTTPPLAPYIKPNPPQGSGPHRYTELLFSQPANFSIPANYARFFVPVLNRTALNLTNFVRDAGLSQPVAANYFFAENRTAAANQTSQTGSASRTATAGGVQATGPAQFKGGASHITSSALIGATALQAVWIMVCMLI